MDLRAKRMAGDKLVYESVPRQELCKGSTKIVAPKGLGVRHVQALLLFFSLAVVYAMRAQLSVSMVSMTSDVMPRHHSVHCNRKVLDHDNSGSMGNLKRENSTELQTSSECIHIYANLSSWNVYRTYDWNKWTQEMIMSSFFVGYTSMMLPMGILAQRVGGKLPIVVALGVNGVLSLVTPWLPIWWGWPALCACRLLQGMTQAALYPSIHTVLARWSPLSERGRLSAFVYTGSQFGTILAFQLAGVFAGSAAFRWPATWWALGAAGLACCGLLARLGAATPRRHPAISAEELAFIAHDGSVDMVQKKRRTPWKHIISSSAVWGLISAQAGSTMGYLLVLTQIPRYMDKVLGLDIKRNGFYSSLPYVAMYFTCLLFGVLADFAANRKIMSVANIRRTANSIGLVASGLVLVGFSYIRDQTLAIAALVVSLALHSGVHLGFHINQIDLAPNFAGPIMAFGNMIGNLSGLLVPVMVSSIVKDNLDNQSKWQLVFLVATVIQIVTNTVFVVFVKGTVQPWNYYGEEHNVETEKIDIIKGEKILMKKSEESRL